jgi:hypothetical protein
VVVSASTDGGRLVKKCVFASIWPAGGARGGQGLGQRRSFFKRPGMPVTEERNRQTIPAIFMTRTTRTAETEPETLPKMTQVLTASRAADR